jgi:hypothetical protein
MAAKRGITIDSNIGLESTEGFMPFQPVHDQVLIRRVESEGKTAGGIIIPDTAKEEADGGQSNGRWSGRPQQG